MTQLQKSLLVGKMIAETAAKAGVADVVLVVHGSVTIVLSNQS